VATYTSGPTLVSVYDVSGPIDIVPSDVVVKFGTDGHINSLSLVGTTGGTGMGIVISGAPKIETITDLRKGAALNPVAFIAANSNIQSLTLKTGLGSYNLNGLTLEGSASPPTLTPMPIPPTPRRSGTRPA